MLHNAKWYKNVHNCFELCCVKLTPNFVRLFGTDLRWREVYTNPKCSVDLDTHYLFIEVDNDCKIIILKLKRTLSTFSLSICTLPLHFEN